MYYGIYTVTRYIRFKEVSALFIVYDEKSAQTIDQYLGGWSKFHVEGFVVMPDGAISLERIELGSIKKHILSCTEKGINTLNKVCEKIWMKQQTEAMNRRDKELHMHDGRAVGKYTGRL